jgi:hypothetical protein
MIIESEPRAEICVCVCATVGLGHSHAQPLHRKHTVTNFFRRACGAAFASVPVPLPSSARQLTIQNDRQSHLYTLVVRPDNTFTIKVR